MSFRFLRTWHYWIWIIIVDILLFALFTIWQHDSLSTTLLSIVIGNSFGMLIPAIYYGMLRHIEMRRWRI